MDGLAGKAPVSPEDHCVYLHHLPAYIVDRVEELSGDKQHPSLVVPPWWRPLGLSEPDPKKPAGK